MGGGGGCEYRWKRWRFSTGSGWRRILIHCRTTIGNSFLGWKGEKEEEEEEEGPGFAVAARIDRACDGGLSQRTGGSRAGTKLRAFHERPSREDYGTRRIFATVSPRAAPDTNRGCARADRGGGGGSRPRMHTRARRAFK